MIPAGREIYLECAKLSDDRKYMIICAKNFARQLPINQKPSTAWACAVGSRG